MKLTESDILFMLESIKEKSERLDDHLRETYAEFFDNLEMEKEKEKIYKKIDEAFDKAHEETQAAMLNPVMRSGYSPKAKVDAPTPKKRGRPAKVAK